MGETRSEATDPTETTGDRRRATAHGTNSRHRRAGESDADRILVMQTMSQLLAVLPDSDDVADAMSHLVAACAQLVPQGEASVFIEEKGNLSVYAASSETKRGLDEHQIHDGRLWVRDVMRRGKSRLGVSLEANRGTWPEVVPLYLAAGMRTANTFGIRHGDDVVGALDICDPGVFRLSDLQIEILTVLATSAGIGIRNRRTIRGLQALNGQLTEALSARIVIEQAKGAIAAQLSVGVDEAFAGSARFPAIATRRSTTLLI